MAVYTLGDVHNPLHFTTYSCYGETKKGEKVLKSRKHKINDKLQVIYHYKLHKNVELQKNYHVIPVFYFQ